VDTVTGRAIGQPTTVAGDVTVTLTDDGTRALLKSYHYEDNNLVSSLTVVDSVTGAAVGQRVDIAGYDYDEIIAVGDYAYLVGSSGNYGNQTDRTTLAVVNVATGTQVGQQIGVDGSFGELRFVDDRGYLSAVRNNRPGYYTDYTTTIVVIDADTGAVLGQPVEIKGTLSGELDFSQDRSRLFLQGRHSYSSSVTGELRIVDTETGALVGDSVLAGRTFQYPARNQDGTRVYLADMTYSGSVTFSILDTGDGSVVGTPVQLAGEYQSLQFDSQQAKAYLVTLDYVQATSQYVTRIAVIDVASGALVSTTPISIEGNGSYGYLRFNEDGSRAVYYANGYVYDPDLQTNVSTGKVGLINGETGTLIGSPVAVPSEYFYSYGNIVFTEDGRRVHVVSYHSVTIPTEGGSYGTSVPAAVTTLDTETGALVGPPIELNSPSDDITELVLNDEGTRAYVTIRDRVADTVTFRVYNLDTGVAAPAVVIPTSIDGYNDKLDVNKLLANGNRIVLVGVSDEQQTTTAVIVDADTGLVVGAPVVLNGEPAYPSATLSEDETKLYLTGRTYTDSVYVTRSVVVDTATGVVTDAVPTGTVQSGQFRAPNGQVVKYYTRVDVAGNPEVSTAETVIVVGESGEPIVIRGSLNAYAYSYGRTLFSADGNTMYAFTADGVNYGGSGTYDPSAVKTRFVAIDLSTGTALGEPVEVGGVQVNNDEGGYYGSVGNYVMSTKQYADNGLVSTRLIFVDRTTNALSSLDIPGEGPRAAGGGGPGGGGDYSLRRIYPGTTAVQATVVDDGAGGPAIRLTVVDLATGQIVGTPVVLPGIERGYTYDYGTGTRYYEMTKSVAGDGSVTTVLTAIDTSSAAVVGVPVTLRGDVYYYDFNEDRTRLYVTTKVANADGTFSYLFHIVPAESPAAATVVESLVV
jgi:hypothetical protein